MRCTSSIWCSFSCLSATDSVLLILFSLLLSFFFFFLLVTFLSRLTAIIGKVFIWTPINDTNKNNGACDYYNNNENNNNHNRRYRPVRRRRRKVIKRLLKVDAARPGHSVQDKFLRPLHAHGFGTQRTTKMKRNENTLQLPRRQLARKRASERGKEYQWKWVEKASLSSWLNCIFHALSPRWVLCVLWQQVQPPSERVPSSDVWEQKELKIEQDAKCSKALHLNEDLWLSFEVNKISALKLCIRQIIF